MSKIDFALGELRCGRLPWVAPEVWGLAIAFVIGIVAGVAMSYEIDAVVKAAAAR